MDLEDEKWRARANLLRLHMYGVRTSRRTIGLRSESWPPENIRRNLFNGSRPPQKLTPVSNEIRQSRSAFKGTRPISGQSMRDAKLL